MIFKKPHNSEKVKSLRSNEHLLTKLIKNHNHPEQHQQISECRYGLLCAHLRSQGKCIYPHRKSHYHYLNMVAPLNCLEDEEEGEGALTKKQRKQRKIIEKTINSQIDIEALDRKQQLLRNKNDADAKKELIQTLEDNEKKVIELVNSTDADQFFEQINVVSDKSKIFELKKKAMIQLKKKHQNVFLEIIDKEYRIANRLIRASMKEKDENLYELYENINHDSIPSVRQYFARYFSEDQGIPCQKTQNILQQAQNLYLSHLLTKSLFLLPQNYDDNYYLLEKDGQLSNLKANVIFFNLLVPFKMQKKMGFNKYFYIDCQHNLTFTSLSSLLIKDYATTFYSKFKSHPEYSFGQIEQNSSKFMNWAAKISNKYQQTETPFKVVWLLDNIKELVPSKQHQQFEQEKVKERQEVLRNIINIFNPVLIFCTTQEQLKLIEILRQTLEIEESSSDWKFLEL